MTSKQMVKVLKKNGFEQIRSNGTHLQFYNKKTGRRVIVAMHIECLPKGTIHKILRETGLLQLS